MQVSVQINSVGAFLQVGEIQHFCEFFDYPVLSCHVLIFSGTCPAGTARPIFTLCGFNDLFPCNEVLLVTTIDDVIWGKYALKTPLKVGVNTE